MFRGSVSGFTRKYASLVAEILERHGAISSGHDHCPLYQKQYLSHTHTCTHTHTHTCTHTQTCACTHTHKHMHKCTCMHASKHARSDSEAFWLRPVMAIIANVEQESARIRHARSGFPHPIWFHSSEEGPDDTVQNWSRSDPDGLVRFWPNVSGPEARPCAIIIRPGSGRRRPACHQFPTFRWSCILPETAWIILCKTGLGLICFQLTALGFGQIHNFSPFNC